MAMMMSRRRLAFGLALVLAMPASLQARGAEPSASPKRFVQQIYASYVGNSAKGIQLDSASAVRRYFTPGLAYLILEDGAAAQARGEPPSLDGDAFVGKQDWDIADLSIDVRESGARATAVVSFTDAGKAGKVVVELLKVGESWRIADIQWDSGTLRGLYRKK
jgi:Protein of unknown function (DUF3828)